jgi:hypothetical protein
VQFYPQQPSTVHAGSLYAAYAGDLTAWALARLINRVDVWGGYYRTTTATRHIIA